MKKKWNKPEINVLDINANSQNGMMMGMEVTTIMMMMVVVSNGS